MSNKSSEAEMGNMKSGSTSGGQREGQNETLTAEELRRRRQAYFDRWVSLLDDSNVTYCEQSRIEL